MAGASPRARANRDSAPKPDSYPADHFLHVFAANGCGHARCAPLWRGELSSASVDSPVAVADARLFVGDSAGRLSVFSLGGCGQPVCAPLWTAQAGPHEMMNSSPAVGNGFVFVQTTVTTPRDATGRLLVFPLAGCGRPTCDPVWTADLGGPAGITAAPVLTGDKVIVGSARRPAERPGDHAHLFAFDAAGCGAAVCRPAQVFEVGPQGLQATPAVSVDGRTLFVSSNESIGPDTVGVVTAYDLANCRRRCEPLWSGVNASRGAISPPAVAGDVVFVGKGPASSLAHDAGVYAFDARGCGKPHCRPLKFVQASPHEIYLGAPLAIGRDRVAFVSTRSESLESAVSVLALR